MVKTKRVKDKLIVPDPDKRTIIPDPIPDPIPDSIPDPVPDPVPDPKPDPVPDPVPDPEPEPIPEPEPVPVPSGLDSFDELAEKIKGAVPPETKKSVRKPVIEKTKKKAKKGESSPDSFRIEGYVLLLITDTVFPFALTFANNMLDKRIKISASDLQLNEKDFAKLEPLADQAADYMAINLNPIAGFLLIAGFMYGNNLINLRMQMDSNLSMK